MPKFYGQFDPHVDRFIFERYFPQAGIQGVFVECGAFDGLLECTCKFFEETMGWHGFNLEPVPWIFEELCKHRPNSRNFNLGLSNSCAKLPFRHAISPILGKYFGNGSISHAPSHVKSLTESGCTFEDITVDVLTWREFVYQNRITHVDLFVLDVEGHEISVIEGMRGCDILPDIMCVEFGHIGLDAIRLNLAELGYIYDISSNGNAFFVHKNAASIFAIRRAASPVPSPLVSNPSTTIEAQKIFEEENRFLRLRVEELVALYEAITKSRSWRLIEKLAAIWHWGFK